MPPSTRKSPAVATTMAKIMTAAATTKRNPSTATIAPCKPP
jgi:hypothetical protein